MFELDENGYPQLLKDAANLAVVSRIAEGRPGNDFHDSATGKFTYAPTGVNVLGGHNVLKRLSDASKTRLLEYSKIAKPNQLLAREIELGKAQIIFLRDGRHLAEFELELNVEKGKKKAPEDILTKEFASSGELRDYIVDIARDLGLQGEVLEKFIKRESQGELSPGDLASIKNMVENVRMNDFVDYLHYQLRLHTGKEKPQDEIRVQAGRGYRKKLWRAFSVDQAQEVLVRLQARGWKEADVQEFIVDSMPGRLKTAINVPHKESNIPSKKGRTDS
jgi:hypothetical protein